jgi:hypothetical protein
MYRISGDSDHPLVSTLLLLTGPEFKSLSCLHARIQLELAERPTDTKPGRFSHSSTMRIGVRHLLELLGNSTRADELFVDVCQRLLIDYNDKQLKTKINVFLFRDDLPRLLPLQSNLTLHGIRGSRNLVLRCALEFLRAAAEKPRGWSRIVALARESLK